MRCNFVVAAYLFVRFTPHFFARLVFGAFYKATILMILNELIYYFKGAQLRKVVGMLLFILLFPISGWPQAPPTNPGKAISIAFSANVQGEVEPCG